MTGQLPSRTLERNVMGRSVSRRRVMKLGGPMASAYDGSGLFAGSAMKS